MVRDILAWWVQQMAALLPRALSGIARYQDAVVVRPTETGLAASLRRRGKETPLGKLEPGGPVLRRLRARRRGPVVIGLPAATLLQQSATLPLAAERDLQAVLGHEMDRLTPFAATELYWTWRVQARDRANGRILLRLLLVPRNAVAAAMQGLQAAGLSAAAIEVPDGATIEHLPLRRSGGGRSAPLAAAVCATLLLASLAIPVVRQERAIAAAEDRVAALRPQVAAVDALRRRLAANSSGANLFAAEAARVGNALRALAAITTALPDDTYLTSFAMRERRMSLSGRSASAARLIPALSADPELRDPAFDAPVTRVGERSDLFSIRVTLAP